MRNDTQKQKVFIIVGPTSSGKTSLALEMCKKFNGEIISADSRQVYKYMDIGTGKIPINSDLQIEKGEKFWELDGVKIWGYDLVTPDQYFSGFDFASFALRKAREIIKEGKTVFLVGGTGFYIDLFTGRMKPSKVKPDLELRQALEYLSLPELQERLKKLDPKAFKNIDLKNKARLVRAIEKSVGSEKNEKELPYLEKASFIWLGLTSDRKFLYQRADAWVDEIWEGGLIDEFKSLCEKGYEKSRKLKGLVYKTVLKFLDGEITSEKATERIKFDIHAYIRRQQTWFKKNEEIQWVDISKDDFKEIIYNKIKENI
jgi:tRNA dimethylallyltransferase